MKGDIKACVEYVASKFEYAYDRKGYIDQWFVMKERDGKFRGDCDDFTLTCLWYYYGQSLFAFIWNVVIARNALVQQCITNTGESHIVGSVDNLYFDNWSLKALPKEEFLNKTKHQLGFKNNFFTMWLKLVIGLFFR